MSGLIPCAIVNPLYVVGLKMSNQSIYFVSSFISKKGFQNKKRIDYVISMSNVSRALLFTIRLETGRSLRIWNKPSCSDTSYFGD